MTELKFVTSSAIRILIPSPRRTILQ